MNSVKESLIPVATRKQSTYGLYSSTFSAFTPLAKATGCLPAPFRIRLTWSIPAALPVALPAAMVEPAPVARADPARRPPSPDEIRLRAYQIYEARGRQPGRDLDDWFQAERELLARDD